MASTWFYYDSNGQKQGPVTGGQLKGLAKQGMITPETVVETEEGKTVPASKIQGLNFTETAQNGVQNTASNYFYTDANGYKYGPVSEQQLQSLATQGIITSNTPLETDTGHKGMAGQIPGLVFKTAVPPPFTSTVPPPVPPSTAPPFPSPFSPQPDSDNIDTPLARMVESGLRLCSFFDDNPGRFAAYQRTMSLILVWLVLAGCLANALFYVIWAIKSDTLSIMWAAFGLALTSVVLHFLCSRFSYAGTRLVAATPCRMSTAGLTESLGLFCLLVALAGLIGGVYIGIREESLVVTLYGLSIFISCGFSALCLLNPRTTLNLQFSEEEGGASAGETALSLWYVLLRLSLLYVPTGAVLSALGGIFVSFWACIKFLTLSIKDPVNFFDDNFDKYMESLQSLAGTIGQGTIATYLVIVAGLYPLLMYVTYLLLSLLAEICRAIFDIARNTQNSKDEE